MRRPRIRFTLGTILFAVALMAANCWYLRPPTDSGDDALMWEYDNFLRYSWISRGIPPLVNAVVIGLWLYGTRRFRAWLHGGSTGDQSPPAAFTFFGLHLLAIGLFAYWLLPESTAFAENLLDSSWYHVKESWDRTFGDPGGTIVIRLLMYTLFGILVSGPPLLLAWVGKLLATRYAKRVSHGRFRLMTGLVSLNFCGVAVALCVMPRPFEEDTDVTLDVQILDENSGLPLPRAFVRISNPFGKIAEPDLPSPSAFTGPDGHVRLTENVTAQGERNALWTMGQFSPWGRWLEISAPGYRTRRIPLPDVLGPVADSVHPKPGKVVLAQGKTPPDSCRDLAGFYIIGYGFGGEWIQVEADGRFACSAYSCIYRKQEFGELARSGDIVEFRPIPHQGEEFSQEMSEPLRVIEWGDRRYLIRSKLTRNRLCRAALTPCLARDPKDDYGDFLRNSDQEKPLHGMPRLTLSDWMAFLRDEVRLTNSEGALRVVLDPLNPWK
jgi:hypothetical protein